MCSEVLKYSPKKVAIIMNFPKYRCFFLEKEGFLIGKFDLFGLRSIEIWQLLYVFPK